MSIYLDYLEKTPVSHVPTQDQTATHSDELVIRFTDGNVAYKKEKVKALKHFENLQNEMHADLHCRKATFQAAIELLLENKSPYWILRTTIAEGIDPFLVEQLDMLLPMLQPDATTILTELKKQLHFLSFEQAESIRNSYALNEGPLPYLVQEARKILIESMIFDSREEQVTHYQRRQELVFEILEFNRMIKNHEASCVKKEIPTQPQVSKLSDLKNEISKFQMDLENMDRGLDWQYKNPTMRQTANLARYTMDKDPEIRAKAEAAQKILREHNQLNYKALKDSGADMSRDDLLAYIDGRKDHFLDVYGLVVDPHAPNHCYPFKPKTQGHYKRNYGYRLDNDSPYEFEEEVRKDAATYFTSFFNPMPPRRVKDQTITRPLTVEVQQLHSVILPIIEHWSHASLDQKKVVYAQLIQFNKWHELGLSIAAEDLEIDLAMGQNLEKLTGRINKWGVSYEFRLTMRCGYMLIPRDSRHTTPDRISTIEMLRAMPGELQRRRDAEEAQVREALRKSCAHMHREDFIQAFFPLMKHYQLELNLHDLGFPFGRRGYEGRFCYYLENPDIYALEDEIRTDLTGIGVSDLPERLIKVRAAIQEPLKRPSIK